MNDSSSRARGARKGKSQLATGVLFLFAASTVVAQQAPSADQSDDAQSRANPITLAGQFFDRDFVNYTLFANAIYDTRIPLLTSSQVNYGGAWGWQAGGSVTVSHEFKNGVFDLSYTGDYRGYANTNYYRGTDQNLSLYYSKTISRRWSLGLSESGGILVYGAGFYGLTSSAGASVASNPLSSQSRFTQSGVTLSYLQTRRLSYVFGGSFFLNDYTYVGAIGMLGGSGSASIVYRVTSRTSFGGTYSHTYYTYRGISGNSNLDAESLNFTHDFANRYKLTLSAGVDRAHSTGVINIPVSVLLGGQLVSGYITGPYNRVSYIPSFQGMLTRYFRRSSFSASVGQGVSPGNGTFLTSKDIFANGLYSYSTRRSVVSVAGGYSRLASIANNVSQTYSYSDVSFSYGYTLRKYLAANFRYDLLHYSSLFGYAGLNENRLSIGLSLSSKSIPVTLF